MTITTTLPKWHPYTEEEYTELKSVMQTISTHIPTDKMGWVWNNYKTITGSNETQPCSCGSAAGHWRRAVDEINRFIKEIEG